MPEARTDAVAIGNILVPTRDGGRVPLSQLADIEVVNGASIIARRENRRQISVRTNIRGRDQGSFVADAQAALRRAPSNCPPATTVDWGGQFENLERARKRLTRHPADHHRAHLRAAVLRLRLGGDAGLVLMNVPFSLVGGIVFLYLRGINLSVSAAVGFISLFGVAVMSGVLLSPKSTAGAHEPGAALEDAVIAGRARAVAPGADDDPGGLLGMVPAARATGIGSDVQRPLATVVVGGLLFDAVADAASRCPALYWLVACRKTDRTRDYSRSVSGF